MKRKNVLIVLLSAAILCLIILVFFIYRHNDAHRKSLEDADEQYNSISEQLSEILGETAQTSPSGMTEAAAAQQAETKTPETQLPQQSEKQLSRESETQSIPEIKTQTEAQAESESETLMIPEFEPQTGEVPEPEEALTESITETEAAQRLPKHFVIFVGDSRTVGMGQAEAKLHPDDSCIYIGEPGEGYNWFIETGLDLMDETVRAWPDAPVVFNLGVNDCDKISAYIEVYHDLEKGYPDTDFYYMSVNPVTEDSVHVPLEDVLAFNRDLKAAFPDRYIDTCSWMISGGFEDVDGVHYSREQYCKIHDFAVRYLAGVRRSG